MNRNIKIIRTDTHYWTISIDGQILQLSRYRHRIDLGVAENVGDILKIIEDVFMWRRTFLDVRGLINGSNLLVLLDAIYPESTVELFENLYRQQISESYMNFKAFFFHIFSFTYESRYKKFSISKELHSIVTAISSEVAQKVTPFQTIQTDKFTVTYISTIGNVASFIVNDSTLEICLSGQPYMCNPAEVMGSILNIQDALKCNDRTKLESIIEHIGSIATIGIMQICYPALAIDYFTDVCDGIVQKREPLYPQSVLRGYFRQAPYRGPARSFFYTILQSLERKVPYWNRILFEGNHQEILSAKNQWTLFYYNDSTLLSFLRIRFIGAESLQSELQKYLLHRATIGRQSPDVIALGRESSEINICINILYNHLDIYFESVHSLTNFDIQLLLSYFTQNTNYNYKTILRCLMSLRLFYRFITCVGNNSPSSAFYKIKLQSSLPHPTIPMSPQAKDAVFQRLSELPPVAQIGIKIACCTGLRSGSFGELLASSLTYADGKYTLRVFLKKTYKYRIKNSLPAFIDYAIPSELGIEIKQFIADTQSLRIMLNKPYLLVYQPASRRSDTSRLPIVFGGNSLAYYSSKLLMEAQLYNSDGFSEKLSLRNIRAEMGRSLFASGKSAREVSSFLGNSSIVAQTHYNNSRPIDDAKMYDALWQETIEKGIASCSKPKIAPHPVMYGTCTAQKECSGKDCRKCPSLIQCNGGDANDIRCSPTAK